MRKITWFTLVVVLASCSSPKMVYYFDHYDYNAAKKNKPAQTVASAATETDLGAAEPASEIVTSPDVAPAPVTSTEQTAITKPVMSREEAAATLKNMSKEERKEFKEELKKEIKKIKKDPQAAKALGGDLRWAAIFGAIGIVLLIIGGDVLGILGAVALLIGLFFLIRYLSQ